MDQPLGAVRHALDDIVLARIIHGGKYADIAFDVQREPVILDAVLVKDLLGHDRIHAALSDLLQVLVHDVCAAAGDKEIRLHKSCNEGGQAAHLSAGAQTEEMSGLLILANLLHVLGRELAVVLRLVEIQCPIKITCKNLLHDSGLLSGSGPQTTKSSLTDALSFHILTCTSPWAL